MDNFKSINDQYGHLVGDEILRNIGHLLRSSIRQEDEAFRWGGDEFVILFKNQNLPVVEKRMLDIRQRLKDFRVRGYGALPISFSWGTAEAAGPLRAIVDAADHEMYSYKRSRPART
jgi:diguanylate cyclase (GGDEF)-like protein